MLLQHFGRRVTSHKTLRLENVLCNLWHRFDHLREAEKQFSSKNMYLEVKYRKQIVSNLREARNKFFRVKKSRDFYFEKEIKVFYIEV